MHTLREYAAIIRDDLAKQGITLDVDTVQAVLLEPHSNSLIAWRDIDTESDEARQEDAERRQALQRQASLRQSQGERA